MTAAVGSVGGDTPTELIAATRNRTATPAVKPVAVNEVVVEPVSATTVVHDTPLVDDSIRYPVIGRPPSSPGADHANVARSGPATADKLVGRAGAASTGTTFNELCNTHGCQAVAHLAGDVATVVRVAVAELPEDVPPPALDGVVVEQRTRVEVAGGDRSRGATRAKVHRPQEVAHLTGAVTTVRRCRRSRAARRR